MDKNTLNLMDHCRRVGRLHYRQAVPPTYSMRRVISLTGAPIPATIPVGEINGRFVALFEVPVIVAAAHFASTFPPYPMKFWVALGIVALAAAIAHVATMPLKGPPSLAVVFLSVVASTFSIVFIGFCRHECST